MGAGTDAGTRHSSGKGLQGVTRVMGHQGCLSGFSRAGKAAWMKHSHTGKGYKGDAS